MATATTMTAPPAVSLDMPALVLSAALALPTVVMMSTLPLLLTT